MAWHASSSRRSRAGTVRSAVSASGTARRRGRTMGRYLLRRLLIILPAVLGISVVLFTVLALAPGDPFAEMALNPNVPPEVQANLRKQFGLDDPVWQRYFRWLLA